MLQQVVHAGFQAVKICLIKTDFENSDSINLARFQGINILKRAFRFPEIRYLFASFSVERFKQFSTLRS